MATITKYSGKKGITWQVKIRRQGRTESATFRTKKEAEDWSRHIEDTIVRKKYFPDEPPPPQQRSVADLIDVYTARILSQKAPKTQRNHGSCLQWWRANLGDTLLSHVTPAILEDYIHILRNKGYSPAYVNQFINALSPAFTLAVSPRLAWLVSNPFSHVKRLREPAERAPMLTPIQIEQLIDCCDISKSKHLPLFCRLVLACGGRKSEILTLTWGQIDFRHSSVTFRQTKGRRQRTVPLPAVIMNFIRKEYNERFPEDYLADVNRADQYIFPSERDHRVPRREIHIAFANARARCGLEHITIHDMRHVFAGNLLTSGQADILSVSLMLGHSNLRQTQRYLHLSHSHIAQAVERMADEVFKNQA